MPVKMMTDSLHEYLMQRIRDECGNRCIRSEGKRHSVSNVWSGGQERTKANTGRRCTRQVSATVSIRWTNRLPASDCVPCELRRHMTGGLKNFQDKFSLRFGVASTFRTYVSKIAILTHLTQIFGCPPLAWERDLGRGARKVRF